ncbi:hypothetical protein QJS10_CPB11g01631 [Acorus calamus]|uniref:Uncharacterized protein n=1 Tax=Acorus calamus TaxID=4465 RepID=A0AAV9DT72_ACOCL|nr:hypothetical protein QJS10_CPB11g01631 [Acorus calamus]
MANLSFARQQGSTILTFRNKAIKTTVPPRRYPKKKYMDPTHPMKRKPKKVAKVRK